MPPYIACRLLCIAIIAFALAPAMANELSPENTFPSFAELHAAGVIIGEIRVNVQDIFDLDDPKEHNFLFRLANTLHINTRPDVIRRTLLFKSGETVSVRLIEETERLLHDNRYLYDVSIRPVAYQSGIVDIEVKTRDTWTLNPGVGFSRAGGSNSTGLALKEYNLLGMGVFMSISHTSTVDRKGKQLDITIVKSPVVFISPSSSPTYHKADLTLSETGKFPCNQRDCDLFFGATCRDYSTTKCPIPSARIAT